MFKSLTTRLIAWSLLVTGVVFVTTIGLSNYQGRRTAMEAAGREATDDTDAAGFAVEDVLDTAEESAAALARSISELQAPHDVIERLIRRFSEDNKTTVARYAVILESDKDAAPPAWYVDARNTGAPGWSEPYRDNGLNATVITLAAPIRGPGGRFDGAAGASVRLDFLSSVVRDVHLGVSGFALVLTRSGLLVAHSRRDLSRGVHDPLAELTPELRALVEPVAKRAES